MAGAGITETDVSLNNIAVMNFDSAGRLNFAFQDSKHNGQMSLMYWNDSAWVYLGAPGFTASPIPILAQDIVFDSSGTVYTLAYGAYGGPNVCRYDISGWTVIGTYLDFGQSMYNEISINPVTQRPQVSVRDISTELISVFEYVNNSWSLLGGSAATPNISESGVMITGDNGHTYVAYIDDVNNHGISVREYNGTTWNYVGQPAISGPVWSSKPAIVLDSSGALIICYNTGGSSTRVKVVVRYNGLTLDTLGMTEFSGASVGDAKLKIDKNGSLYVLHRYFTQATPYRSKIYRYLNSWTQVDSSVNIYGIAVDGNYLYKTELSLGKRPMVKRLSLNQSAFTNFWTGNAGNGLWSDPGNWSNGILPTASADVTILAGANIIIDISAATCQNLTIPPGATLSFSGTAPMLHVTGTMVNNGTFNTGGGTLQVDNP